MKKTILIQLLAAGRKKVAWGWFLDEKEGP
jgi:hypothetical protein